MRHFLLFGLMTALLVSSAEADAAAKRRGAARPTAKRRVAPIVRVQEASAPVHLPGLRGDASQTHFALGPSYGYGWESTLNIAGLELHARSSLVGDLRVAVPQALEGGIDAVLVAGHGRLTGILPIGGLSAELGGGLGVESKGAMAFVSGGLLYAMDMWEVGYNYQQPLFLDRPQWLGDHQISVRFHLPLAAR